MARKHAFSNLDDLIARYEAGETVKALADETGVSNKTLDKALRESGVTVRGKRWRQLPMGTDEIVRRYESGESLLTLAGELAAHPNTIADRLRSAGVRLRPAVVARRAGPESLRGRPLSIERQQRVALTRERLQLTASPDQLRLAVLIEEMMDGQPRIEAAIGKYNIDLALRDAVAVEVCGGHWHLDKRHRSRAEYLFDQGWNLMFVWSDARHQAASIRAAEEAVTFLERTERDPSFRRQYRMIWGSGEFISSGCADRDDWALIGPFKHRMH